MYLDRSLPLSPFTQALRLHQQMVYALRCVLCCKKAHQLKDLNVAIVARTLPKTNTDVGSIQNNMFGLVRLPYLSHHGLEFYFRPRFWVINYRPRASAISLR